MASDKYDKDRAAALRRPPAKCIALLDRGLDRVAGQPAPTPSAWGCVLDGRILGNIGLSLFSKALKHNRSITGIEQAVVE